MATVAPEIPVLPRDEAFETLYRRYVKDVYHYALALLRNPADAEDVTQTTFLNAYRAFQRGEEIRKPQHWLIKIAHNVARSRYARNNGRVREVPLEDHVEQLAVAETERPNVEGVLRALGRLPFNQRAALILRELEGRSYVEIADTLGVSVAAVETLIFRARRSLRVRTAALRSILTVPVPTSVTQLLGGGGVTVSGVGAGFAVKAAVALVAGAVAAGVSSDVGTRAVAASKARTHEAAGSPALAATSGQVARAGAQAKRQKSVKANRSAGRGVGPVDGSAYGADTQVAPVGVSGPSSSSAAAPGLSAPAALPAPLPQTVTNTLSGAVDTVVGTVDQTVTPVSSAIQPVNVPVPQLPVQPPQLPNLP